MSEAGSAPAKSLKETPNNESSEWGPGDIYPVDSIPEKRAVRKLDLTILPVMTLFYLLSFLVSSKIYLPTSYLCSSPVGQSQHRYVLCSAGVETKLTVGARLLGNARVAGLQAGLHLTDHQFQVAVTVTFVYVASPRVPT